MKYIFSKVSNARIATIEPRLQRVVTKALDLEEMDVTVICGVRTKKEQAALYEQGRTKPGKIVTWTLNSKHLPQKDGFSHAVDLAPYPIDWNDIGRFLQLKDLMKRAANHEAVNIICGADWKAPKTDLPHYELAKSK